MNLKQAIGYPFRPGNRMRLLAVPVGLQFAAIIAFSVPILMVMLPMLGSLSEVPPQNAEVLMHGLIANSMGSLVIAAVVGLLLSMACWMPVMGYYWALLGHWQTHGMDSDAPAWQGNWKLYFKAGQHFFLASLLFAIPSFFAMMTLGLLLPFVWGPFILSARERTIGAVLRNTMPGFRLVGRQYLSALAAVYVGFVLMLVYSFAGNLLAITIVAGPVLMAAGTVTFWYLMAEAFPGDDQAFPAPDNMSPDDGSRQADCAGGSLIMNAKLEPNRSKSGAFKAKGPNPWQQRRSV